MTYKANTGQTRQFLKCLHQMPGRYVGEMAMTPSPLRRVRDRKSPRLDFSHNSRPRQCSRSIGRRRNLRR
jgi:hypothetical protein